MKLNGLVFSAVIMCAASAGHADAFITAGDLLVNLDAAQLSLANNAVISEWPNGGELGGDFLPVTAGRGPIFEDNVAGTGVAAATFRHDQNHTLTNSMASLDGLVGTEPVYSFEAWIFNPSVANAEYFFAWTIRDNWPNGVAGGSCVEFRCGNENIAVEHNAANVALGDGQHSPATPVTAGVWHHYCATRDAEGRERFYIDGFLRTYYQAPIMRVRDDGFFTIGSVRNSSGWTGTFGGSIAKVRVHSDALSPTEVFANFQAEAGAFGLAAVPDYAWDGSDDAWENGANWSGGLVPGAGDRASITAGNVTLSSSTEIARLIPINGGLTIENGAALTVLPEVGGSVNMGLWSNNVFNLTITDGALSMIDNTNAATLYAGNNSGQFSGVIGDGNGRAVLDAGRDVVLGAGNTTPPTVSETIVGPGGELFSSNGWIYVGIDSAVSKLMVTGGTVGNRTADKDIRIGRNSAQGILEVYDGLVAPSQDLYLTPDATAVATAEVYLYDGVIQARRIYGGNNAATNRFYFDGGTVRNRDGRGDFMFDIDFVYVRSGGAKFDILEGTAVTAAQPLFSDTEFGDGGIIKTGLGTLTLSGAHTVTGAISVLEGQLVLNNANALPSGYAAPITIAEGAAFGYAKTGSISTILGLLDQSASGTLLVTSANVSEDIDLTLFPNLRVAIMSGVNYTGTITPYQGAYRFAPVAAETFSKTIAGSATLTVSAATTLGSLELTVANNFTDTTVDGSMLIMNHPDALGTPAAGSAPDIGLSNGGSLVLRHAGIANTIVNRIKPGSQGYLILGNVLMTNVVFNLSGLPGVSLGTDQQSFPYTGALTVHGNNEYRLGGGRILHTTGYDGLVVSTLTDASGPPRKLVITGLGMVRSSGNTHSGGTLVTNGASIHLAADSGLGAVPTGDYDRENLVVDGGVLRHSNVNYTLNAKRGITVGPNGMITHPWSGVTLTHDGSLHGSGAITNTDSGNIVLGGTRNDWDGTLTLLAGRYLVGNGSNFSWGKNARVHGRNASFGINYNGDKSWSDAFGAPLCGVDAGGGHPLTSLSFHKEGTGTLTLDVPQTYTGATDIRRGTLQIGMAGNPIPNGANRNNLNVFHNNAANYGVLDLNGYDTQINGLRGGSDTGNSGVITNSSGTPATLFVGGNNASTTFTGSSTVPLVKNGTGMLTLNAPADIHAGVSAVGGTLTLGPAATLGSDLVIASSARVAVTNSGIATYGLMGEYYDFSDASLRYLCDATNFSAYIMNGGIANYRPKFAANSAATDTVFVFNPSFPSGVPGDYFVARYTGEFFAEAEGEYTFATASDDGSCVLIDRSLVVSNIYEQGYSEANKRAGTITLTYGWHDIEILFFDKTSSNILAVWLTPPGGEQELLRQELLRPYPATVGAISGGPGAVLTFASPALSLLIDTDTDGEYSGAVTTTSDSARLIKAGSGTQAFRGISFAGETDVIGGTLAIGQTALVGGAEPTFSSATVRESGALEIRAFDPDWPASGLMGAYHYILGYSAGNQGALATTISAFNNRVPFAVYPTTLSSSGEMATFRYNPSTTFPAPFGTGLATDFQVLWQGRFVAREAGEYGFRLESDDRTDLYLDGELVVTNAVSNGARNGSKYLAAGTHSVMLPYQQGGGGYHCTLSMALPGTVATNPIPNTYLRPGGTVLQALGSVPGAAVTLPNAASFLCLDLAWDTEAAAAFSGVAGSEIEKAGETRLILTGDNDAFLGNWFIPSGELCVGDGGTNGTLGGSSVYISAGGTLAFDRSDNITVNADIEGLGTITSRGTGTVTLSGEMSKFKGIVSVDANSTVALDGTDTVLPDTYITGDGSLRLDDGGALLLSSPGAFAQPLVSSNGMLALTITDAASVWHLPELTLIAGTEFEVASSGLWGRYYDMPGLNATAVSNAYLSVAAAQAYFAGLTPALVANTHLQGAGFDFGENTRGTDSFPGKYNVTGGTTQNFCVVWHGKIRITIPGTYTFSTASDDHSMLFIGDQPVVNNNGSHGIQTRSGTFTFPDAGLYEITIMYAQGGGSYGMKAEILFPGETVSVPIPNSMLIGDPADTPAYTLTVDKINVIGESGAGTVVQAGAGMLKFGALSVDIGTRLVVIGGNAAVSDSVLEVTISESIPYGVVVVGDFSETTSGLSLSGVSLQLFGSTGNLRYDAAKDWLQIGRSSGALMILK